MAHSHIDDERLIGYQDLSDDDLKFGTDERASASNPRPEGSGTWAYLGLLGLLFVGLVGFSFACEDRSPSATGIGATNGVAADGGGSARVLVDIDRGVVTVDGSVPDEASRDAVINAIALQYGPENVVDGLTVDPSVTLDGGVLTIAGRAEVGDGRPGDVEEALQVALDLSMADVVIDRIEAGQIPADLTAQVDGDQVVLSGVAPDDETVARLVSLAGAVWGVPNVDASSLSVGDTSLAGARLAITGSALPGDERSRDYEQAIRSELSADLQIQLQVESSVSAEVLADLEARIKEVVTEQPILFEPRSAEIDAASDAVLQRVAQLLEEIPAVPVEVVGHTDSEGVEEENLVLSQDRAEAVVVRLEDLGVDRDRLTSRGEGQSQPVASNDDPVSRALNRRIEFLVIGAADSADSGDSSSTDPAEDPAGDTADE
jgi:outer membrane protein OmpA-like peptidoglycan-associated protein